MYDPQDYDSSWSYYCTAAKNESNEWSIIPLDLYGHHVTYRPIAFRLSHRRKKATPEESSSPPYGSDSAKRGQSIHRRLFFSAKDSHSHSPPPVALVLPYRNHGVCRFSDGLRPVLDPAVNYNDLQVPRMLPDAEPDGHLPRAHCGGIGQGIWH